MVPVQTEGTLSDKCVFILLFPLLALSGLNDDSGACVAVITHFIRALFCGHTGLHGWTQFIYDILIFYSDSNIFRWNTGTHFIAQETMWPGRVKQIGKTHWKFHAIAFQDIRFCIVSLPWQHFSLSPLKFKGLPEKAQGDNEQTYLLRFSLLASIGPAAAFTTRTLRLLRTVYLKSACVYVWIMMPSPAAQKPSRQQRRRAGSQWLSLGHWRPGRVQPDEWQDELRREGRRQKGNNSLEKGSPPAIWFWDWKCHFTNIQRKRWWKSTCHCMNRHDLVARVRKPLTPLCSSHHQLV